MTIAADEILLNSREMARFVSAGYLRLDAEVPEDINLAATELFAAGLEPVPPGRSVAATYPPGSVIGGLLALPRISGAIRSLVGPAPIVDHHWLHVRYADEPSVQRLHSDGMLDLRRTGFDVQLMYYPAAVPAEMGPLSSFLAVIFARSMNSRSRATRICAARSRSSARRGAWCSRITGSGTAGVPTRRVPPGTCSSFGSTRLPLSTGTGI